MKELQVFSLTMVALGLMCSGCEYRKYPEGPVTSVIPAKDRLANTWRWALAVRDDENRTGILNDSTIEFRSGGEVLICPEGGFDCREGNWALVTRRSKLNLIFGDSAQTFDIERLTRDEVYLRSSEGEAVYWELSPVE
jgi:hypothetical protein